MDSGYLLINKPSGPTSHDVIDVLRRLTNIKKIGHSGTLDPLASGLLLVAVGRAVTKNLANFVKLDKTYEATACLGVDTDTYDSQGKITKVYQIDAPPLALIQSTLVSFLGRQEQTPPAYSAKKIKGKKAYELARQNIIIDIKPCLIEILALELLNYDFPQIKFIVSCGSGTYVRSLVFDLGQKLGCGAHLTALVRTSLGQFNLAQSVDLEKLTKANGRDYLFDQKD
jgi:tRNA pseudouridine55 synthase